MVNISFNISPDKVKDIRNTLADWYGIKVTDKYLGTFLKSHPVVACEIYTMGLDTAAREMLVDHISKELTGSRWPINGDSVEYKKQHYDKFREAVKNTSGVEWNEG